MTNATELNLLAAEIHKRNHHWWHDEHGNPVVRERGELLMLVITELAEAVEGIRKNLMDDKLPHRKMEEVEMADAKIRLLDFASGFGLRLASTGHMHYPYGFLESANKPTRILHICIEVGKSYDCFSGGDHDAAADLVSISVGMIEYYCKFYGFDLAGAVTQKMAYNQTREDHKHEARNQAHGKKF
jgi:hypothetical protein